ncbi:sigma-70 family RNA polymerase sigma factor [Streptomyces sp. NPDC097619]|uniref:sigma-70 family RNA polymerase sigma factor n=1 Tax=Streptomyces sp. NPDC097619 TaxID=3157228 RepID=UPI0033179C32
MSVDGRDESPGDVRGGSGTGPGPDPDPSQQVPAQREGGSGPGPAGLPPSDSDLIALMRAGDDGAYAELFRRHSEAVRRYARGCCRDAHTAEDLTAEVFARTLQAVRGGAGPDQAVRAYLLTTVRRVAAGWTKTARRERLVEDFAAFAEQAARGAENPAAGAEPLERGADVRAMEEAEHTLAMRAFRSLPERWQAVLWHTTVEQSSPSTIAPLFGLTPNATAVLASRAREGLKQAYLQAHVSDALSVGGDCALYADRLGAYARGGLRMRAERGLRKHLEECARCRLAAGELKDVNAGIPALLPVAVIGWFAAGYAAKAAGVVAGGAVAAGGAGAAAAAGGAGGAGASGAAAGTAGTAGAAGAAGAGSAGGAGGSAGGAAAAEGLGMPAKAAIAAGLAVATAAGVVFAFVGDDRPAPERPVPPPRAAAPAVPSAPARPAPSPTPPRSRPPAPAPPPASSPADRPRPSAARPVPPARPRPTPPPPRTAAPSRPPVTSAPPAPRPSTPPPKPSPRPTPRPTPPQAPRAYSLAELPRAAFGDHTGPELRRGPSSWVWQRWGLVIDGRGYAHGITVRPGSAVGIDLNRPCRGFSGKVGVDDMAKGLPGTLRFSVHADGALLWTSPELASGDPAVAFSVSLEGRSALRLTVEGGGPLSHLLLGDWAESVIRCR